MELARRTVLNAVPAAAAGGLAGCGLMEEPCEVACFEFFHEGYDDAPDLLTIRHVDGRDLPAGEVSVTNVLVEHGPDTEWVSDTVPWHELDEDAGPSDGIAGRSVRVDIGYPDRVRVLWRDENEERVLDETTSFR